jgi:hypothetical protein
MAETVVKTKKSRAPNGMNHALLQSHISRGHCRQARFYADQMPFYVQFLCACPCQMNNLTGKKLPA